MRPSTRLREVIVRTNQSLVQANQDYVELEKLAMGDVSPEAVGARDVNGKLADIMLVASAVTDHYTREIQNNPLRGPEYFEPMIPRVEKQYRKLEDMRGYQAGARRHFEEAVRQRQQRAATAASQSPNAIVQQPSSSR
ncbi:hypothetical protein [Streptomyces hygroscopicus]|uniref:hypothetical protein n=1 Tax=Streptomyces hygroscopicus TaxID=1912 RepID=UPI00223F27F2|nr:hypothetical protein [Streptomyces hygroscopicus]